MGSPMEAESSMRNAVALDESDGVAHFGLASALRGQQRWLVEAIPASSGRAPLAPTSSILESRSETASSTRRIWRVRKPSSGASFGLDRTSPVGWFYLAWRSIAKVVRWRPSTRSSKQCDWISRTSAGRFRQSCAGFARLRAELGGGFGPGREARATAVGTRVPELCHCASDVWEADGRVAVLRISMAIRATTVRASEVRSARMVRPGPSRQNDPVACRAGLWRRHSVRSLRSPWSKPLAATVLLLASRVHGRSVAGCPGNRQASFAQETTCRTSTSTRI